MSQQTQVSLATVMQAYLELERNGLVEARPKFGFFVRPRARLASPPPRSAAPRRTPRRVRIEDVVGAQHRKALRMVLAIATNSALLGLGIKENTGLVIEDETTAKVVGTGTVIVVDGNEIEIDYIRYAKNKAPFAMTNVIYSILSAGMVYDLERLTVVDPASIALPQSMVPKRVRRSRKAGGKV